MKSHKADAGEILGPSHVLVEEASPLAGAALMVGLPAAMPAGHPPPPFRRRRPRLRRSRGMSPSPAPGRSIPWPSSGPRNSEAPSPGQGRRPGRRRRARGSPTPWPGSWTSGWSRAKSSPSKRRKGPSPSPSSRTASSPRSSAKNPLLGKILAVRPEKARPSSPSGSRRRPRPGGTSWARPTKPALHVYTRSDACGAAETWAAFLEKRQEDLKGIGVYGDPGLAEAVRRDPLGIGFNNINYAYDAKTLKPLQGIAILPIDLDGSGKIEPERELLRRTGMRMTAAIARGAYPSPPARDLYLVSKGRPAEPAPASSFSALGPRRRARTSLPKRDTSR